MATKKKKKNVVETSEGLAIAGRLARLASCRQIPLVHRIYILLLMYQ